MAVACGIFLSLLGWLGGSESGFSALCSGLPHLTAGRLQISGPGGRLLGDWRLQSLRWQDAKLDVEIEQLAVAWWPSELAHGEALFERVEVASLRIFSVQSTEPPAMPASLQLPLALRIKQLAVGRVLFGKNMTYGKVPQLLVEGIEAGLASDGRTHRLDHLRAQVALSRKNSVIR